MQNIKILITGSSGLVGSYLYKELSEVFDVVGLDMVESKTADYCIDSRNLVLLKETLEKIKPDIIIHTSAVKSLLACEKKPDDSWLVNVESTAVIVQFAEKEYTKVIYISSDVVFDGKCGNYKEGDMPHPINVYGKTKYESEKLVMSLKKYAICRTALVIGELNELTKLMLIEEINSGAPLNNQSLLPYYILEKLKRVEHISLPDKIISNPTSVQLLAVSIQKIISNNLTGIFHCVGSESVSRFEFALRIADFFGMDSRLVKVDEDEILPIRPKNLSMNFSTTYDILGFCESDWNIDSLLKQIKT